MRGRYKPKLRKQGYRLVYQVDDDAIAVLVLVPRPCFRQGEKIADACLTQAKRAVENGVRVTFPALPVGARGRDSTGPTWTKISASTAC